MSRDTQHEIIVNPDHQYVVWPARKPLPIGWNYVGKSGRKEDLDFYLREMFVETMPAPLVITDGRPQETRWG
jgi:MbtH protein